MPRTRLTLALTAAAVFATASPALAGTTVYLDGPRLHVKDTASAWDVPMDTTVVRDGSQLRISDEAGKMHAWSPCSIQGADAVCPASLVTSIAFQGGNKNDVLTNGTTLKSTFHGDSGDDVLQGGPHDDELFGAAGDDKLRGGAGRDSAKLEPGEDTFDGEDDVDTINYAASNASVTVTLGDDFRNDGPASDLDRLLEVENVIGSPLADEITGSDARNVISGRAGGDDIDGRGGDDLLDGEGGGDDVSGGLGVDTATYADRTRAVKVFVDNGTNDGEPGENDNIHSDVDIVEGSPFADTLTSIGGAHTLNGNDGDDTLDDGAGVDTLNGGDGDDRFVAGPGADTYIGALDADLLDYAHRSEPITVTLSDQLALDGGASDAAGDTVFGMENVATGSGADSVFVRNGLANVANCGLGPDTVQSDQALDFTPGCEAQLP